MRDLPEIQAAWLETDEAIVRRISESRRDDSSRHQFFDRRRQLNNYAYFVLVFAQFEDYVNEWALVEVQSSGLATWKSRRIDARDAMSFRRSLSFMDRVEILIRAEGVGRGVYDEIDEFYDIRCRIAHGITASIPLLSLPSIIESLKRLATTLKN